MVEIKCKGVVKECGDGDWVLKTVNGELSEYILVGIDYLLKFNNMPILEVGEELEIDVRIKNRK